MSERVELSGDLGRIGDVDLLDVPRLADCLIPMEPVEYNIVIALAAAPKTAGKMGSILLPDITKDQLGLAQQVGRIVAQSPLAYNFDTWPPGARKPEVGDVVWFARYGGGLITGRDGREYRTIKDKDVIGIIQRAENVIDIKERKHG